MFQSIFGKIGKFGWWGLERISADAGTLFTSTKFHDKCQTRVVRIMLVAPDHQEMSGWVEVTWRTLRTISHSLMVHARVLEAYIHFSFMYTADHNFLVISIKYLINEDSEPTTPYKLATGMKPSILHLRVLFCPCVVRKTTAHVSKKALNMRH